MPDLAGSLALSPLLGVLRPLFSAEAMPVYLVGGAVRDALLGLESHDLDFVVPARAIPLTFRVGDALSLPAYVLDRERDTGRVVVPGTLPGQLQSGGKTTLDFARFRAPTLEGDLRARDFTINAMALPAATTTRAALVDPLGGVEDLAAGLVRLANDNALHDDPVRTLRAVRMAVRFGFHLTPETAEAATLAAPLLAVTSAERIRDELVKLLGSTSPERAVELLSTLEILVHVLPEIAALEEVAQTAPHHEAVLAHTILVLRWLVAVEAAVLGGRSSAEPALVLARQELAPFSAELRAHVQRHVVGELTGRHLLRFAALFHDAGKAATQKRGEDGRIRFYGHDKVGARLAASRLRQLRMSKEAVRHVQATVAAHMRPLLLAQGEEVSRRAVYRFFRAAGSAGLDVGLLSLADHLATHAGAGPEGSWEGLLRVVRTLYAHYFDGYEETISPPPLVDGTTLMSALKLEPGPEVGRLLRLVQEAQAAGEVGTAEEALTLARQAHQGSR